MAGEFEPPPTYTLPVEVDGHGNQQFNPIWINWFYKLVRWLNAGGGVTPAIPTVLDIEVFGSRTPSVQTMARKLRSDGSLALAMQLWNRRQEDPKLVVKRLRSDAQQILANQVFGE